MRKEWFEIWLMGFAKGVGEAGGVIFVCVIFALAVKHF